MNIYVMIVFIVLISFVGTLMILQQVKGLRHTKDTEHENRALKNQVNDIEERVRILERIVTDKKNHLKDTIDTL